MPASRLRTTKHRLRGTKNRRPRKDNAAVVFLDKLRRVKNGYRFLPVLLKTGAEAVGLAIVLLLTIGGRMGHDWSACHWLFD